MAKIALRDPGTAGSVRNSVMTSGDVPLRTRRTARASPSWPTGAMLTSVPNSSVFATE